MEGPKEGAIVDLGKESREKHSRQRDQDMQRS